MSASRLPLGSIAAVMAAALSVGAWKSRPFVTKFLTGPGNYSRILALAVVLANYKNFPFVWHIRVWHGILSHMVAAPFDAFTTGLSNPHHLPALFQPCITPAQSPASECDYNLHKSNSTYFSDLDVTRSHLVAALMHVAIRELHKKPSLIIGPDGKPAKGQWGIMLGGVHCSFKREIKPYEKYEMWSRMLAWDRKWLYVVTHFVKAGTARPAGWTLDDPADWNFVPRFLRTKRRARKPRVAAPPPDVPEGAIFASAISKYVMKVGRLTVHPEAVLDMCDLLPPKPGGWNTMDGRKEEVVEEPEGLEEMEESVLSLLGIPNGKVEVVGNGHANGAANGVANGVANGAAKEAAAVTGWDWTMVEAENAKGMEYAKHHAALDSLSETFTGNKQPALGYYTDIF
ncbi:hypothetical protein VF21_08585 [Pseudogymnoascus sp. 05NY08]|nr:hypothetical protein VF21_08585 [Pseudogymnoascus sp. 05NY08]